MKLPAIALFQSYSFRLSSWAAAIVAGAAGLILASAFFTTTRALQGETVEDLRAETAVLLAAYDRGGITAVNRAILERGFGAENALYLLAHPNGQAITGALSALPPTGADREGVIRFTYRRAPEEAQRRAIGVISALPGGYRLLVGADFEARARLTDRLARGAWIVAAVGLALAVAAGAFLAKGFLARLDALNAVANAVAAGDLQRRAARVHSGDELDALAGNLNDMLDRLGAAMTNIRHAGDAIAHDLRTPLTRLRNRLEAAALDADADPRATLEQGLAEADQMLATFNAILRLSRLETGAQTAHRASIPAAELLADIAELYEPACEDKGLGFSLEVDDGLVLEVDRALVSQAVANLLDNAVKYTPVGGAVRLIARRELGGIGAIGVADSGPGIPPELRARVTDRFVRLEASRTEPGSGLGLALVKAVADAHGARFELLDAPEGGLLARIGFPLRDAAS